MQSYCDEQVKHISVIYGHVLQYDPGDTVRD